MSRTTVYSVSFFNLTVTICHDNWPLGSLTEPPMLRTQLIQNIGKIDRNMNNQFNSAHGGLLPERTGVFVTAQGSIKGGLRMRNHVRVVHLISYAQETRHNTRREKQLDEDFREEERDRTQDTRSSRFMVATRSIPSVCSIFFYALFFFQVSFILVERGVMCPGTRGTRLAALPLHMWLKKPVPGPRYGRIR